MHDQEHLLGFVSRCLGTLPGVTGVETSLILKVAKFSCEWEIPYPDPWPPCSPSGEQDRHQHYQHYQHYLAFMAVCSLRIARWSSFSEWHLALAAMIGF